MIKTGKPYELAVMAAENADTSFRKSFLFIDSQLKDLNNYCSKNNVHLLSIFTAIAGFLHYRYTFDDERYNFRAALFFNEGNDADNNLPFSLQLTDVLSINDLIRQTDNLLRTLVYKNDFLTLFDAALSFAGIRLMSDDDTNIFCSIEIKKLPNEHIEVAFNCQSPHRFAGVFRRADTHAQCILSGILKNDKALIKNYQYLGEEELRLIHKLSRGPVNEAVARPIALHEIFEQTCVACPENPCVLADEKICSYTDINKKANRLAHYLIEHGVQPGDFAGILLKRSADIYIAMLGIMKAGAAYVPMDPAYPKDRVKFILDDCKARVLISESVFDLENELEGTAFIDIKNAAYDIPVYSDENPDIYTAGFNTDFIAYIIYTSGTTGMPKGVLIPHKNISNLVKAEGVHFLVNSEDRVLQGFSVAFDASLEEIWLAFHAGALLVVATDEAMHSGELLSQFLKEKAITVFSTVPTMLSMMSPDIPLLRLVILGGEAARYELLEHWAQEGRRIINSYGPTEATVIATYWEFAHNRPVTIGKPITNYSSYILDAALNIMPLGIPGEIHLGGNGVAKAYINNPELTERKFVAAPRDLQFMGSSRFYKSGDLGCMNDDGEIAFLGRIDTQVKLRGYRIELSGIEAQIMDCKGVKLAVCKVHEGANKVQRLVAYIKEDAPGSFSEEQVKQYLRSKMASYNIPALFVVLDELPLLPSGKVDRKKLPDPNPAHLTMQRDIVAPKTETEKIIHSIWEKLFAPQPVSVTDDFFDLGGHSLLATMLASEIRKHSGMGALSVQDIYKYPVLEQLAAHIDTLIGKAKETKTQPQENAVKMVSWLSYYAVAFLQAVSVVFLYSLTACFMLLPCWYMQLWPGTGIAVIVSLTILGAILLIPFMMFLSWILKWTLIGRFKEGKYPLWGFYYFRFWLVKKFVDAIPLTLISGTPFINFYFRAMGAKIGRNVYMGTDRIRMFDLTIIGDDTSIMKEANLMGYVVENNQLIIGRLSVGKDCFVGIRSLLNPHTVMEDHSSLGELSLLPTGSTIPKNVLWQGSPAKPVQRENNEETYQPIKIEKYGFYILGQTLALISLFLVPSIIAFPFMYFSYQIYSYWGLLGIAISLIPMSALFVVVFCLSLALIKWMVLGKSKEEVIKMYSGKYVRKWLVDTFLQFSLMSFRSIYATIYLPSWLRLLGAKVGRRAEVSTVNQISADLLTIGKESFLADSVSIGAPIVRKGLMQLRRTRVGDRTFIGNSAVMTGGKSVGDNALIGVLSIPPRLADGREAANSSWLGSPPMFLPKRQIAEGFTEKQTFDPPAHMIFLRGLIEFFRITLPIAVPSYLLSTFYHHLYLLLYRDSTLKLIFQATMYLMFITLIMCVIAIFMKWVLIGRYKPQQKPLWNTFVWRNELVNALCESMVYPFCVNYLQGTPFAAWFFRAMGCTFGKRVFMETTEITEFDLVKVGDYAALNFGCTIQTHLFEDRIMKMSYLYIMNNSTVGPMAVVLYSSEMENNTTLNGLSLLMKGEVLPSGTRWQGSPASIE